MSELITLKDKIRFALLPKKIYLGYQAKRASRRFEPELELLRFVVPRGRNAIDGGAHKGIYSWYLAKLCTDIYAFEPNPTMYNYLCEAVPGNVKCYPAALSDRSCKAQFNVPTSKGRFHHTQGSLKDVTGLTGRETVEVDVTTIDQQGFLNVGFIKLDLEGAELEAIKGAVELIQRDRPVILAEATGVGGSSPVELTGYVESMGYIAMVYRDGRLRYFADQAGECITHNCFYFPIEQIVP